MIGGTVKAEGGAVLRSRHRGRQERVAGCCADALADAVGEAEGEDVPGPHCEGKQGPGGDGERVAPTGQGFSPPEPVRKPASRQLKQARRALGNAFHQPKKRRRGAQPFNQEQRQERKHHLARRVVEQRDECERAYIACGEQAKRPAALSGHEGLPLQ